MLARMVEAQRTSNDQLAASLRVLAQEHGVGPSVVGERTKPA